MFKKSITNVKIVMYEKSLMRYFCLFIVFQDKFVDFEIL